MPKTYQVLPTLHLNANSPYFHTGELPELIHIDEPALNVMLDYKHTKAITIAPNAPIIEANIEMNACGVHLLLVTDEEGRVVGLISSEDILGEKPVKITREKHISRVDMKVRMVMTKQEDVIAIDYEILRLAKVGSVIQTLKNANQHYALVIEIMPHTQTQMVRGLFSLSQSSKQLAMNVVDDDALLARSLLEFTQKRT
ncbi:MAG: CBS domain-containing protein [Legionellales bacterium]|nr:CBS domain-containing protein [Legionellales bacterium]